MNTVCLTCGHTAFFHAGNFFCTYRTGPFDLCRCKQFIPKPEITDKNLIRKWIDESKKENQTTKE